MAPGTLSSQTQLCPSTFAPPSFAIIVEKDHDTLSTLVLSVLAPSQTSASRTQLVSTILWRLIRHDVSEDLVMRPAFVKYMGDEGAKEAEQDRTDHASLKRRLLDLFRKLKSEDQADQEWLVEQLRPLSRALGEHMRDESRVWIPKLVAAIGEDTSLELGRDYARTLILTPDVHIEGDDGPFFQDLMDYANANVETFSSLLKRLEDRAARNVDEGYFDRKVEEEMKHLGLQMPARTTDTEPEHEKEAVKGKL